jgi:hypothetical protein
LSQPLLRPSSQDFPQLRLVESPGQTKVRETETVVDETVVRKTEEYRDENGQLSVRTVEIIEKVIEKEVLLNAERGK